tara:strand:- start:1151 stop:1450 length:300 start_codon:yes stop_codon:yes gene_type:complete
MLTHVDHIAIESRDIKKSVKWYLSKFNCSIKYQDNTWALLEFDNISIALVKPGDHPPHFAVVDPNVASNPKHKLHRDGIAFLYELDPDANTIEKIDRKT